jgi:predicted transcriptional regulator/transcriptional regulator with XRE-family HTH domain
LATIAPMSERLALGAKVRALRRQQRLTQTELARRLGISASYLNLIEHNRRTFGADLLVRLAEILPLDLKNFSPEHDGRAITELLEVFGDPLFENLDVIAQDVKELATAYPAAGQAIIRLYEAFRLARASAQDLAETLSQDAALDGVNGSRFPSEEVSDLIQRHMNYFPELEQGAEALWRDANLDSDSMFNGLVRYLKRTTGIEVRVEQAAPMQGALRRYDPERKTLQLSEVLRRGSRNFQLAYQIGLLTQGAVLDRFSEDPLLTTDESRASCRVGLANYFAAAVLMPYRDFLAAAQKERYDIELLGHRFRTSFEQTCHRMTTLRRPGDEGIPFHMLRVDIAGNMSKRFSASGLRIPRFSGACPRWNVFGAFLTPGMIRTQLSQMPDGQIFFGVARTVRKESGGYKGPRPQYAISMGCDVSHASKMVYADGLDLSSREALVPVGPSCRLCERMDCEQRAYPPLHHPFPIDENRRGVSFYAPPPR